MTNKTKQAALTRRMAEALRSMQLKMDSLAEFVEDEDGDFSTEYLGEETAVLIDVLIHRLGFAEYSYEGNDHMLEVVCDYIIGKIEYEDVLSNVAESHKLHAILLLGDDWEGVI
ncbi:hypothetical protein ACFSFY_02540 [Sporosarcina siberiensis]|uniref:Uncharacterized protein n=1 Tax=Sporosarcina siberiensis TaxID=1365606 RepID=A0ABW4SEX2_9BACL